MTRTSVGGPNTLGGSVTSMAATAVLAAHGKGVLRNHKPRAQRRLAR
jgi:hypothetical protein